jgi:DNA-binding transcriptional LysR family regulator
MLDLNDVALFVRVVEAGSFSGAARLLGLPPNTVSRRIRLLEEHLGVRLMQRSTRRLTLTAAGTSLHERSSGPLETLAEAAQALAQDSASPSGTVRVAAPVDFFSYFRMDWIAEFVERHPLVDLQFQLDDARADLLGEAIDVAFRSGVLREPTLVARPVGGTSAVLMASPAYLVAQGTPTVPEELSRHQGLLLQTGGTRMAWRLEGLGGVIDAHPRARVLSNTIGALLNAALAGIGIALLPREFTVAHVERGELEPVLPGWAVRNIGLHIVWLSGRQQPAAVRAFIDFVVEKMTASPFPEAVKIPIGIPHPSAAPVPQPRSSTRRGPR